MGTIATVLERPRVVLTECDRAALLKGDVLTATKTHSAWGGAVTAEMFLPVARASVWQQVTNYPRWAEFFPDILRSEVLDRSSQGSRLYQVGRKAVLMFAAEVEIYLQAIESATATEQRIQFQFERGSFRDFAAQLCLQDFNGGTRLTYAVQATPLIPVPSLLIQEGMKLDLPANLRQMRQVLCRQ